MLGRGNLAGRALDPRTQVFAGEPADLDAPTLDLRVELRPGAEAFDRCVEETRQTKWRAVVDVRPSLGGPGHSDNRITLAIYTPATDGTQDSARATLDEALSRSGC